MKKIKCNNCGITKENFFKKWGKKMILKDIWIEIDNDCSNDCQICRKSYKKDSKIIAKYKN